MTAAPKRKRCPPDLQSTGKTLWNTIIGQYTLDPAEYVLLHQLCRAVDMLDRISADLAEMGVVVSGSEGQPRVNPLLGEQRAQVRLVDQLQQALALPIAGEPLGVRRAAKYRSGKVS